MSSFKFEAGGPIAQNKANSSIADFGWWIADWGQTCAGTPVVRSAVPSLLHKQTQFGPHVQGPRWHQSRKTKPISGVGGAMVTALRENGYGELDPQDRAKKQSQFRKEFQVSSFKFEAGGSSARNKPNLDRVRVRDRRPDTCHPAPSPDFRAKQSQFAAAGK